MGTAASTSSSCVTSTGAPAASCSASADRRARLPVARATTTRRSPTFSIEQRRRHVHRRVGSSRAPCRIRQRTPRRGHRCQPERTAGTCSSPTTRCQINSGSIAARADSRTKRSCAARQWMRTGPAKSGMGVDAKDVDDDGDEDVLVVNLDGESDSFYRNDGVFQRCDGSGRPARDRSRRFTRFGTGWIDFDNDGWLDFFQANGRVGQQAERYGDDVMRPSLAASRERAAGDSPRCRRAVERHRPSSPPSACGCVS